VSRLVGAPPGYVGFDEGGQLTEAVRRKNYCVVLLDEVEKAHPEVFNILLQILEDGHLSDAKGRRVDFRNCIIIMTSNLGAKQLQTNATLGFRAMGETDAARAETSYEIMKEKVAAELKNNFRPEFLNRIDATVVFRSLTVEEITTRIEDDLKRPSKKTPNVSVGVAEYVSHTILVSGLVKEPGPKIIKREAIPLYVVVADAQTLPEAARVTVLRHDSNETYVIDLLKQSEMKLLVRPGDVVMADGDGVVVVPRERAEEVAAAALPFLDNVGRERYIRETGKNPWKR
jgi:hypothetical protein